MGTDGARSMPTEHACGGGLPYGTNAPTQTRKHAQNHTRTGSLTQTAGPHAHPRAHAMTLTRRTQRTLVFPGSLCTRTRISNKLSGSFPFWGSLACCSLLWTSRITDTYTRTPLVVVTLVRSDSSTSACIDHSAEKPLLATSISLTAPSVHRDW